MSSTPLATCSVALFACSTTVTSVGAQAPTTFIVESPTMETGVLMPRAYSPDGPNLSPNPQRSKPAPTR